MSPGHDPAIALMQSQQLWLPAQELLKTGPFGILSQMGAGLLKTHPSLKRDCYWQLTLTRGGQVIFYRHVASE